MCVYICVLFRSQHLSSPEIWITVIFQYKDWAWIQNTARDNQGKQLHCRRLKTWKWEKPIYKYFGERWQKHADDKDAWAAIEHDFLRWRALNK